MITRDEMLQLRYNPNLMQRKILKSIENYSDESMVISDPTNPFNMLLEAATTTASNALLEAESIIRKKYPSLAVTMGDLYHHITDDELTNMFAIPAECNLVFYVNILDIKLHGFRPEGANYVEMTIPEDTCITVYDTPLTLLNDIVVKLYDNGTTFVEQQVGSTDLSYTDIGIISSGIVTSQTENVSWIMFEAKVKQVKKQSITSAIVKSNGCNLSLSINNEYVYSKITIGSGNNTRVLARSHTDEYIDPSTPTCYISIDGKVLTFSVPDVYLNDFNLSGQITIDVYETLGKMYLPIDKLKPDKFSITLGKTGKTKSAAASANIAILCRSNSIIEGGSNAMTAEEMKASIINNTTGDIDLPVTDLQLSRYNQMNGYTLFKVSDVITNRLYIAAKSLPDFKSDWVKSKMDVYFNTCSFMLNDLKDHYNISVVGDYFIIKSNTIFRLDNGSYKIMTQDEVELLQSMNTIDLIEHLKNNIYYYNPYYYIVRKDASYSYSEVYDLDKPKVENLRIVGKNTTVAPKSNISKYTIQKTKSGYKLIFSLITNSDFDSIPVTNMRVQVKMKIVGVNAYAYFDATQDVDTKNWSIDITTDHSLDEDATLDLTNGDSDLFTKRFDLNTEFTIYTYTVDPTVQDPSNFLSSEIRKKDNNPIVVFTKEYINVTFGYKLDYIWNKLYNTFTDRKYQKYTEDIAAVYEEDVYEVNPETGGIFTCGEDGPKYNILHHKGEPVLDEEGQPVYKHRIGDVVLDRDGLPIVDAFSGVVRYVDILMLEYVFKVSNNAHYTNYIETTLTTLRGYMVDEMESINSVLLDNTKIMYRSFKSNKNVLVSINNINYSLPFRISPKVTLYVNSENLTTDTINSYSDQIGGIIDRHLDNETLVLENLRNEIKETIGSIVAAVKVENIDSLNSEIITIVDKSTRLSLEKEVDVDKNNRLIVRYNVQLDIQYV